MLYLDSHMDTLFRFASDTSSEGYNFVYRPGFQVDVDRLLRGGVNACWFVLYIPPTIEEPLPYLIAHYNAFNRIIRNNPELRFAESPSDISTIYRVTGKISVSLGMENGIAISNISSLRFFRKIGVRYITLCHNRSNHICDSSTDKHIHHGLSPFGLQVVHEMNKLGLMIDISHMSDSSAFNVLKASAKPVIASHSGAYSICPNDRNLNDDLLKLLAQNNGVVQVTMLPKCVSQSQPTLEDFLIHIDYIRKLIGVDYIGIGSDFDGGGGIQGCEDVSQMGNVITGLEQRNYSTSDIEKILGLNFLRVYEQNYNTKGAVK